jgi:NAD(P)-dependent dehydrogenase (short-subunit alcohol dehydrogenase family)
MQSRLQDRNFIVLGAASGIGAATVRRLTAEGARVCVADINVARADTLAAEVRDLGGDAFAVEVDIADEASVNRAVDAAVKQLGALDGAHINAADLRAIWKDTDVLEEALEIFDRTFATNLRGHVLCTRAVLPHLLDRGEGAIVYTSSTAADEGEPNRPAYAVSKSGMNALMRHVASRWGRAGITANCVAPGLTITPEMEAGGRMPQDFIQSVLSRTPNPRLGRAEDIAGVVAMLLSADGRWINGQVYTVNGGYGLSCDSAGP